MINKTGLTINYKYYFENMQQINGCEHSLNCHLYKI